MKIIKIQDQDKSKYNDLALSHGTIFNTLEWTNLFNNSINRYGIYDRGGTLIGGFIIYQEKMFGLSVYRNPPFTPAMGPFLKIDACNPVSIMDTWKKTLSLISAFLEELPYSIMSFSFNKNVIDMQPFIWKRFKVTPGYTYILDLSISIEDIWKRMSNERRKNINKGIKDNLTVKKLDNFEIIRDLVLKTYIRQEKRVNQYYLEKILFEFLKSNNHFAFATYQGIDPIACAFIIYDKYTAYYLLGGYDEKKKHHGAGAMSMWEAVKYAQGLGLQYFDFEGSMNPKIERYFRGFGGTLTAYYKINKAKLPLEMIMKFYKRELY